MGADLDDPVVLPRGLDHRPALGDRHRQRLLDVDVLARLAGGDHLDRVPVVGRGDHHRVDVLAIEERPEVLDARDVAGELRASGECASPGWRTADRPCRSRRSDRLIDIAEGDDPGVGMGQEPLEELAAAVAHADEAQPDLIVGPRTRRGEASATRGAPRSRGGPARNRGGSDSWTSHAVPLFAAARCRLGAGTECCRPTSEPTLIR